jgi:hypothetical protein
MAGLLESGFGPRSVRSAGEVHAPSLAKPPPHPHPPHIGPVPELLGRLQSALADRYRLDREAGAGGMATVYLAQDIRHGRPMAVKVLRLELAGVIGAERFLAEIKRRPTSQHPQILPLFDSGEADATSSPRTSCCMTARRDKSYSTGATTAAIPTDGTAASAQRMQSGHP